MTAVLAGSPLARSSLGGRPDIRVDLQVIADMIERGSRVLDVGCGDGALLDYLVHEKAVDGRGIELSQAGVNACVSHGLPVIQGDADTDLSNYLPGSFDYVILSQTLQATREPRRVLSELVRIGRRAIVSFPNFGHWRVRFQLLLHGRMPHTAAGADDWYDTPNIHPCTVADFVALTEAQGIVREQAVTLDAAGRAIRGGRYRLDNLLAQQALFVLSKRS